MGYFILGFVIAWVWSDYITHIKVASECERLGGFYVGSKTYKCHAIIDIKQDKSVPSAIVEAEKLNRLE